jgi:hypothetical protein
MMKFTPDIRLILLVIIIALAIVAGVFLIG